jgi:hypothetical protein
LEKTEQKNTPILLFLCLVQEQTSLDEFGRKKSESDEKVERGKKSYNFFLRPIDLLTFFVRPNFEKKNW